MAFTKFKLLAERLLSGLGRSKTFFPFYDSQNDADYRVSLDTLITFISNELGVSSKAVFELTGVSNTGNNYVSTLDITSYKTEGLYIFKPSVDSDDVSTLNVNSIGILDIKEFNGTSIVDKTDLKAVNTYLLLNKTSYWLVVGGVSGGDPPVPDLSGYIPLTGTPSLTGDITTSIGAERTFGYNTLLIKARWVFSYLGGFAESWLQSKVNNYEASVRTIGFDGLAQVQISVGNGTISKTLVFASEETCKLQGDILRLDDIDRNSAIASHPKALITKEFADANYLGGATNLGYTPSPTNGIITSDTGTDATLTLVDGTNAGLVSPSMKSTWDGKQNAITFGTGVLTALGVNTGTAGSFVVNGGISSSLDINGTAGNGFLGLVKQTSNPSAYIYGIDGVKQFVNSSGLMSWISRIGDSVFTKSIDQLENIVGDIVNDNFDRTTSGYRLGGSNISQAIVSNQLVITNTTGNAGVWNNFITNDSIVWSDEYDYSVQLVGSTNGAGLGLGLRVDGYIGMGIRLDMSSSGTRGLLYLVNINPAGTETILQTSTVALSYANGDSIRLGYRMDGYMVTPYVQKNGGSPISMVINANLTSTEQSFRMAEEKMYVFSFGGVQNLTNLNFKINSRKNADLALVGDSRFYGYNSGTEMTNERICSQLIGNYIAKGNFVNYSVSGGRISQLATELDVLLKLRPKTALISIGVNDAGNSLARGTFASHVTTIVNSLATVGIKAVFTTIVPTNNSTTNSFVTDYNTDLRARNDIVLLDVAPSMSTGSAITSTMNTDGIHYNELGHYTFFTYVKDNFQYKSPIQYPFFVSKTSSSNLIGAFPSISLNNANATLENGTTNNNISSISLNSGNNSVSGFITSSYNSGGLGSQLSIGTSTSSPVALYSNNVKRVNISTIGEVGVNGIMYVGGLSAPNAYLQLSAGTAGFPAFSLTSQTAYTGGVVGTLCLENTNNFSFIGNLTMKQGAASNVGTSDNQNLNIIQNNTARLALTSSNLFFQDGYNIALGTTTGTIIGMSPTQKLAFYGGTAIVQPLATTDLGTVLSNLNLRGVGAAYPITTSGAVTMSGTVALTGGILTGASTQNVFNAGSTIIGAFGGATSLFFASTATGNVGHNYSTNATTSGQTKLIEIGTNGLSGSTTNIAIGSAVSGATGTTTINSPLVLKNYTVATLPAGSTGMRATVTDALAPVYDANVVGGGARVIEVIFNGSVWTCH